MAGGGGGGRGSEEEGSGGQAGRGGGGEGRERPLRGANSGADAEEVRAAVGLRVAGQAVGQGDNTRLPQGRIEEDHEVEPERVAADRKAAAMSRPHLNGSSAKDAGPWARVRTADSMDARRTRE